jgi:hypothetical protein
VKLATQLHAVLRSRMELYLHSTYVIIVWCLSEWSASCPSHFTLGEGVPSTQWIGDWVSPRASLDPVEYRKISCPYRESNPGLPDHNESLYQLGYIHPIGIHWRQGPESYYSILYYTTHHEGLGLSIRSASLQDRSILPA